MGWCVRIESEDDWARLSRAEAAEVREYLARVVRGVCFGVREEALGKNLEEVAALLLRRMRQAGVEITEPELGGHAARLAAGRLPLVRPEEFGPRVSSG